MDLKKGFLPVKEVCENGYLWLSEDEILHAAAADLIPIHAFGDGFFDLAKILKYYEEINEGETVFPPLDYACILLRVPQLAVLSLLKPRVKEAPLHCLFDDVGIDKVFIPWDFGEKKPKPITLTKEDLLLTLESITKFKEKFPESSGDTDHTERDQAKEDPSQYFQGSNLLSCWVDIAKSQGWELRTAKRRLKGAACIRHEGRKVVATADGIAKWRLTHATKKKKRSGAK